MITGKIVLKCAATRYSNICYESGDKNKTVPTQQTRVTKLKSSQQWPPHHITQFSYSSHVFPIIYLFMAF